MLDYYYFIGIIIVIIIITTIIMISEQHSWRARHHGTAENSRIGHCAHTAESNNVKAQNGYYHGCNHRTAETLYPRNMVYFRGIVVNTLHKGDT
jgi:hypothetical protein